jgi:hypothetical protein
MSLDPEFIGANILKADDSAKLRLGIHNAVELLHVSALRVALANRLLIVNHLVQINSADVVQELRRHSRMR